jgi:hypothetical protein
MHGHGSGLSGSSESELFYGWQFTANLLSWSQDPWPVSPHDIASGPTIQNTPLPTIPSLLRDVTIGADPWRTSCHVLLRCCSLATALSAGSTIPPFNKFATLFYCRIACLYIYIEVYFSFSCKYADILATKNAVQGE